jgi:hypothetical protein
MVVLALSADAATVSDDFMPGEPIMVLGLTTAGLIATLELKVIEPIVVVARTLAGVG